MNQRPQVPSRLGCEVLDSHGRTIASRGIAASLHWKPMSTSTTRSGSTAPHALWLGGLLVVLAGLFGMHGLDSHGAAGADTIAHAVMIGPGADPVASGQDHMPRAGPQPSTGRVHLG